MGNARVLQDDELWQAITSHAKRAKSSHVAVAYLGRGAHGLLPLNPGSTLVVDMSDNALRNGQTDPKEIGKYLRRGVEVYSCEGLHAKVYVFANTVIVASANVSSRSRNVLREVGVLQCDRALAREARGIVRSFQSEPGRITPGDLKRARRIYRPPRFGPGASTKPRRGGCLWLVAVGPDDAPPEEERIREAETQKARQQLEHARRFETEGVRPRATDPFASRVQQGDRVVQIWREGRSVEVWPPAEVVRIKAYKARDKVGTQRKMVTVAWRKGLEPLGWQEFRRKVAAAGLRTITPNSVRQVRSDRTGRLIEGLW